MFYLFSSDIKRCGFTRGKTVGMKIAREWSFGYDHVLDWDFHKKNLSSFPALKVMIAILVISTNIDIKFLDDHVPRKNLKMTFTIQVLRDTIIRTTNQAV